MKRERFQTALRSFLARRPFRPFTLELSSGGHAEVTHPEALMERSELLVFRGAQGTELFEIENVVRFIEGLWTPDNK